MEHLLTRWQDISQQLKDAKHILLLIDYDGTLTPIVGRPEMADLADNVRQLLESLKRRHGLTLSVISGRALKDIKSKVKMHGIIYAGNHGLEIEGPGINYIHPVVNEIRPVLDVISTVLKRTLGNIEGIIVEDKGLSLSVHYRLVAEEKIEEVKEIFERVISGAKISGKVRITTGKKVYEVRPAVDWDKGKAVKLLMKRCRKGGINSGLVPIYLGDDLTDEDAFKAIDDYGKGISVFVGEANQETAAGYSLESPAQVITFLEMLLDSRLGGEAK
ncbi:MAG: trehalose-phosphatase [Chloroflexota bacterium]